LPVLNCLFDYFLKNSFNIAKLEASVYVTKDESSIIIIDIKYGGSNAGYHNMIGTYELDDESILF